MKFFAKAAGKRGEIYIYEDIGEGWFGGISAKSFSEAMRDLGKVSALDIYINSYGGSVFDGIAIYNQIKRFDGEKVVHIDGIAASIASVIAMAGDEIVIAANGTVMIHDPWGMSVGTADEMRKCADSLDLTRDTILDTYLARTKGDRKKISDWMAAESWMNADQAVERGFADKKVDEKRVAASASKVCDKFKNMPADLKRAARAPATMMARMDMRTASLPRRPAGNPA